MLQVRLITQAEKLSQAEQQGQWAAECKSKLNERISKVSFNLDFSEFSYSVLDGGTCSLKHEYEYLSRLAYNTSITWDEYYCSHWILDRLQITKR
jgi:hypothetical protein